MIIYTERITTGTNCTSQYTTDIRYIKGFDNLVADAPFYPPLIQFSVPTSLSSADATKAQKGDRELIYHRSSSSFSLVLNHLPLFDADRLTVCVASTELPKACPTFDAWLAFYWITLHISPRTASFYRTNFRPQFKRRHLCLGKNLYPTPTKQNTLTCKILSRTSTSWYPVLFWHPSAYRRSTAASPSSMFFLNVCWPFHPLASGCHINDISGEKFPKLFSITEFLRLVFSRRSQPSGAQNFKPNYSLFGFKRKHDCVLPFI